MLIHNHPSGELEPSQEDLDMTERMVSAGRVLGIDVVDHLIIGPKDMSYIAAASSVGMLTTRWIPGWSSLRWKKLCRWQSRRS